MDKPSDMELLVLPERVLAVVNLELAGVRVTLDIANLCF
jgi:hypothetical protein